MLDVRGSTYRTDKQYMLLGLRGKQRCFIRASGSATIEDITWLVVDKEGTRPSDLRLICRGIEKYTNKTGGNSRTLDELDIEPQAMTTVWGRLRGGMFHATSGRQDNTELHMAPQQTQVTVVVPGHGEVNVMVPLTGCFTRNFTGADLMRLAQQRRRSQQLSRGQQQSNRRQLSRRQRGQWCEVRRQGAS